MRYEKLLQFAREEYIPMEENVPMAAHTTFRIGGPARLFAPLTNTLQLIALIAFCQGHELKYTVIGNGSNLLVPDEGYDGLVIRTPEEPFHWYEDGCTVTAAAGCSMAKLSAAAAKRGLAGLTFAQGIPGTVGGAVVMNAGAYGGQIADTLISGRCILPEDGAVVLTADQHKLSYRHSVYSDPPDWVCLDATFRLTPGDPARSMLGDTATQEEIEALREELGLNDPLPVQYVRYMKDLILILR